MFCEQDEYRELEKTIRTEVQTLFKSRNMKPPYILPVHRYRNLLCNLFAGLPLYQTLPEKKNYTDSLTVTIIGTGSIGTEAFLTTTWMGQLPDHQLNINIISQEEEASFRGRIQAVSPEILEASEPDSEILRLYRFNEKRSDPYYRFCYFQKDVSQDLDRLLEQKGAGDVPLYAADCFIVAAGSDEKNIEIASRLSQSSARKHITYHNTDRTMIAYVVYDDTLTQIQNQKVWFAYGGSSDMPAIYMKTFGALSQVYSSTNIFMENFLEQIIKSNETYNEMQRKEDRDDAENGERGVYSNLNRDPYSLWSSNARAAYIFTKIYAFGFAKKTIWDFQEHLEEYPEYLNQCKNNYAEQVEEGTIPETTRHRIAWLEHRRWNAISRIPVPREYRRLHS